METIQVKKNELTSDNIKKDDSDFLGSSNVSKLIRTFDWSKTSLGDMSTWPVSTRTALSIALHNPMPVVMLWGKDGVMIYNDAYSTFAGAKHPSILGLKVKDGWPEVSSFISNVIQRVLKGEQLVYKNQKFILHRNNSDEKVWLDLTYSPVMNDKNVPVCVMAIVIDTTKRVLAEQKQRLAKKTNITEKKRLYKLFMNAPAAIAIISGPKLVFTLANAPYLQLVGKKNSVEGESLTDVLPELEQDVLNIVEKVAFNGERFVANEMPVSLDWDDNGEIYTKYLNFIYEPIFEHNKANGLMAFIFDVTKQVESRLQVEQSEERYRTLFEKSTDAVQLVSAEGEIQYSSESIKNVLGYRAEELQGASMGPFLHPDDVENFTKEFAHLIKNPKTPLLIQYRVKHKNGSWAWVETTGVNHLKTPHIHALVGTFRNITEHKRAQDTIQNNLRITKAITDTATTCLFMIDNKGIVTFMNPAAEHITGYSSSEAIGKPMHLLVHHSHADGSPYPELDCPLVQMYKYGKLNPLHEDIFFRKDGSTFDALIVGTPIPGDVGQQVTVVEFRDITDEKRAEKELRELISITEQRNALIKINKTKDEFISLASHQLRTPATVVKQYAGILLDGMAGPLNADQMKYLKIAYESNDRELSIINDLLKTAQMTSSEYHIEKRLYDIKDLVQECLSEIGTTFSMRGQTTAFKTSSEDIRIHIDRSELKLAIINLLENASKYSYLGSEIEASVYARNECVEIAITDNGVGIAKEDQQRIFDKFTRVDNDLSDTVTGTGLGLYWVKHIVQLHQGTIKLKSKPGEGSTFIMKLPL